MGILPARTLIVLVVMVVSWRLVRPERYVIMSKLTGVNHAGSSVHVTCCIVNVKAGVVKSDGCFVIQEGSMLASYGSKF